MYEIDEHPHLLENITCIAEHLGFIDDNDIFSALLFCFNEGFLEEVQIFDETAKQNKKAYRLRYGNLQKAWNFVEAHLKVAIENYGKTVEHLQKLVEKQKKGI